MHFIYLNKCNIIIPRHMYTYLYTAPSNGHYLDLWCFINVLIIVVKENGTKTSKNTEAKKHQRRKKRQQLRWEDCVKRKLRRLGEDERWREQAADRKQWREQKVMKAHWETREEGHPPQHASVLLVPGDYPLFPLLLRHLVLVENPETHSTHRHNKHIQLSTYNLVYLTHQLSFSGPQIHKNSHTVDRGHSPYNNYSKKISQ